MDDTLSDTLIHIKSALQELKNKQGFITRFAPSPTGYLHLGHVFHLSLLHLLTDNFCEQIIFRIEDHDQSRARGQYLQALVEDTTALGFGPFLLTTQQSNHFDRYQKVFEDLKEQNLVYPCTCTRRDLMRRFQESKLKYSPGEYDGYCRKNPVSTCDSPVTWRLKSTNKKFKWHDLMQGNQSGFVRPYYDDFAVRDRDGQWTYQFAVVVDDSVENIEVIIRGEDLLASTARQSYLRSLLDKREMPLLCHHNLLVDEAGKKLSKRSLAASVKEMLNQGAKPTQVIADAARAAKIIDRSHLSLQDLKEFLRSNKSEKFLK